MDKKIERVFELLKYGENATTAIMMYSRMEGEFGTILCTCSCELNGQIVAARVADNGEPDGGYSFRLHEIQYFVSFILPLFNPLTFFSHEIPQSQAPQPSEP